MRCQQREPSEARHALRVERFGALLAAEHHRPLAVFHAREPVVVSYDFFADHTLGVRGLEIVGIEMTHAISVLLIRSSSLLSFLLYQVQLKSRRPRGSLVAAASPPAQLPLDGKRLKEVASPSRHSEFSPALLPLIAASPKNLKVLCALAPLGALVKTCACKVMSLRNAIASLQHATEVKARVLLEEAIVNEAIGCAPASLPQFAVIEASFKTAAVFVRKL